MTAVTALREVVLHGELARQFGKVHRLAVASPAEAVRALGVLHKGFDQHLRSSRERGVAYHVWQGGHNLSARELTIRGSGRIYISPQLTGAKRAGLFELIAGIVIAAVAEVVSFGSATPYVFSFAASLGLGGIAQLLAASIKTTPNSYGDSLKSNYFDGPANVTAQGNPVPIGYGQVIAGSVVISAGISVDDLGTTAGNIAPSGGTVVPLGTKGTGSNTASTKGDGTTSSTTGTAVKRK